jgi:ferredoxin
MLPVSMKKGVIRNPECIGCLDCVSVCPRNNCLTVTLGPAKKLPVFVVPFLIVSFFLLFWLVAEQTGHWHNSLPIQAVKKYYSLELARTSRN